MQGGKGVRNVGRGKGCIVCANARERVRRGEKEHRRSRGDDKGQELLR